MTARDQHPNGHDDAADKVREKALSGPATKQREHRGHRGHDVKALTPARVQRVRSRATAYVYGNILALAAVVGCSAESILSGRAVITVLATTAITYLAHVVAHRVGQGIGHSPEDAHTHLRAELRDAVPIATSGLLPSAVLLLAALGWVDLLGSDTAQLIAAAVVVARLGATSLVASRLGTGKPSHRAVWSAAGLALAGLLIAVAKVKLTH